MTGEVDLLSEIEAAVRAEWETEKLPLPLSALGSRLSDAAKLLVRAQNVSLRKFISDHLSDRIRLLTMRREGGGAVPLIETSDLSESDLEKAYAQRPRKSDVPRFFPVIWDAFRTPIPNGMKRYILTGANSRTESQDLSEEAPPPPEAIEIPADRVVSGSPVNNTIQEILAWSEKSKVPMQQISLPDRAEERARSEAYRIPRQPEQVRDLFALLSTEELSRISIPGDLFAIAIKRALDRR